MTDRLSKFESSEKSHFDAIADRYDVNYGYGKPFTRYKIAKKALDFVRLIKPILKTKYPKMLEIGCGTGEYTGRVARLLPGSEIVGLDISGRIVKIAQSKCKEFKNVSFVVRSAYNTDYKSNSLDVVYGFYVLHHLEIKKIRKELLRILKPGGLAFFYEPNIFNPVVFLIKSNKFLKRMVGDSPDERAINPVTIGKLLGGFNVLGVYMSEFVWPTQIVSASILMKIDKMADRLKYLPVIKYLGGSVEILLQKR